MFDYKNAGLYPAAFQAFKTSYLVVIIFATISLAYEYLKTISGFDVPPIGDMIIEISFAFFIHQTILLGGISSVKDTSIDSSTFIRFLMRGLAFAIIIGLTAVLSVILAFFLNSSEGYFIIVLIVCVVTISLPLVAIFLSVFGTVLPAVVAGADVSFGAARVRSRGQFWTTIIRFLVGPVSMVIVVLGLLGVSADVFKIPFEMFDEHSNVSIIGTIVTFALNISGYFISTLYVTILCKAYLNATPQTDNT